MAKQKQPRLAPGPAQIFLRRGSSYYCRLVVPTALRGTLGGREQLWKSLRTRSLEVAKLQARVWEGRVSKLFLTLSQHGRFMKPEQIQALVTEYVNASLEAIEETSLTIRRTDDERDAASLALTDALEESTSELLSNDFYRIEPIADELISNHGLSAAKGSLDYKKLCRGLLVGFQTAVRAELKTLDGDYSFDSPLIPLSISPKAPLAKPTKLFSEVMTLYFSENKRAPRTDAQIKAEFERFLKVIGGDKRIGEITKENCRLYKETLLKSVGISTANKHLHSVAHLWQWAEGQGFVPENSNPIKGLIINKRLAKKEKQERKPFSDADLSLIFGHSTFKAQCVKHPERYWLVLCLLLSGARREEIAQLDLADIWEEKGIHFFNITNEGGSQSLKTSASKRRVPVHSYLIQLGFPAYVQQMKRAGHTRLFPQLEKGKNGYGDAVGKWFGRLIRQLGLTDPSLVLHSLRHTVITRLIAAGVPQDIREILVGHASETVHGQVYTHREGVPLSLLKTHLEKLRFTALEKAFLGSR